MLRPHHERLVLVQPLSAIYLTTNGRLLGFFFTTCVTISSPNTPLRRWPSPGRDRGDAAVCSFHFFLDCFGVLGRFGWAYTRGDSLWPGLQTKEDWDWQHLRGSIRNDISMSVVSFFISRPGAREYTYIDREASTKREKRGFFVYSFLACAFGWFCGLVAHGAQTTGDGGGVEGKHGNGGLMDMVSLLLFHSLLPRVGALVDYGCCGSGSSD